MSLSVKSPHNFTHIDKMDSIYAVGVMPNKQLWMAGKCCCCCCCCCPLAAGSCNLWSLNS